MTLDNKDNYTRTLNLNDFIVKYNESFDNFLGKDFSWEDLEFDVKRGIYDTIDNVMKHLVIVLVQEKEEKQIQEEIERKRKIKRKQTRKQTRKQKNNKRRTKKRKQRK